MSSQIAVNRFTGGADEWDRWIAQMPSARFSQQYDWLQLIRDVYGGDPHYLAASRGDEIVGVMPVMLRSVIGEGRVLYATPFADEGGCCAEDPEAETALIEAALGLGEELGASYLEVRQRTGLGSETTADLSRVNMEMGLPDDAEVLWDGFKGKVRNQVRKAEKSGLTAHLAEDIHAAISDEFYPVYCENTRDLGSPMHAERFFHEVTDRFPGAAGIVLVREDAETAGAAFAMRWGHRFAVPWAASLRRYFRMCPNNLLYWELMRTAIDAGCRVFDFGRSPRDSGTYRFKEQWGAEPVQLRYCRYGNSGPVEVGEKREGAAYRLFTSVWQRTPVAIARRLGPRIFARLPI
ncbi:MAG: FemAB family XrtA/PEP-CTERM system-associated protein [Armatimonadota bacterium]